MKYHAVDLFDEPQVRSLVQTVRPTHLLHVAWIATPGIYWTSPENYRWVNASESLFESFAEAGGERAVLVGTCAEYDWTGDGICREFDTPLYPTTVYGQCKNELRKRVEESAAKHGVSFAWARIFFLYGPGEHPVRLVPSVTRSLLLKQPAECTAGTQLRDFLITDDAADALVALLSSRVDGPVNVASGEAVPVRKIVELIGRETGGRDFIRFGVKPTPPNDPPRLVADTSRLRKELRWTPRIGLVDGIAATVRWWRGQVVGS
jgi:nucleoside-diphosphate-sugar epimerase